MKQGRLAQPQPQEIPQVFYLLLRKGEFHSEHSIPVHQASPFCFFAIGRCPSQTLDSLASLSCAHKRGCARRAPGRSEGEHWCQDASREPSVFAEANGGEGLQEERGWVGEKSAMRWDAARGWFCRIFPDLLLGGGVSNRFGRYAAVSAWPIFFESGFH